MTEISQDLVCLYSATIDTEGDSYTIEVPKREIRQNQIDPTETYRVALLASKQPDSKTATTTPTTTPTTDSETPSPSPTEQPPVTEGEVIEVEIETLGDQGDGIAKIGPGYVIIVPKTAVGERVAVRIETAKANVAFGEVVKRHDPR